MARTTLPGQQITDDTVTSADLATSSVQTIAIADDNITASKLATSSVTVTKIADSNVTTVKLADNAITVAKIGSSAVQASQIADDNISAIKLATSSVTSIKIADGNVTASKLATSSVQSAAIADSSVTLVKLADNSITNVKINSSAAIAGTKISPDFGAQNLVVDTSVLYVNATSNTVGINTTSNTSFDLQVGNTSASLALGGAPTSNGTGRFKLINSNSVINWQISTNDSVSGALEFTPSTAGGGSTFTTPAMLLSSAGNLGVAESSPNEKLVVAGAIRSTANATNWSASTGALIDYFSGTMRIVSSGGGAGSADMDFYVYSSGTPYNVAKFSTSGNMYLYERSADNSVGLFFGKADGTSGWSIGSGIAANDGQFRFYSNDTGATVIAIDDAAGNATTLYKATSVKGDGVSATQWQLIVDPLNNSGAGASLLMGVSSSLASIQAGAGTNLLLQPTSGNVGVGTTPDTSAKLDISSTTQGFLPPRMTTSQREAISSPAEGLMVFDNVLKQWMGYTGTSWVVLG